MADASYVVPHFLGGEISQFAQGRFDRPDYKVSLNVCLNAFPVEIGAWVRRPGSQNAGHTRGGAAGRVIKFDFEQAQPYTLEFTDGFLRFRNGATLVGTNDSQTVLAVSSANPAVVQLTSAVTWVTGNTLIFPGASTPLLENRQFVATKIDTTHFSLADALTGATIDGSTLGAFAGGATVKRVQELATTYLGGSWSGIRAVQAEASDILLSPAVAPQALTVPTLPTANANPVFAIGQAVFNDGPYLDPFTNGVLATPSAKTGIVQLSLSFQLYVATTSYRAGDFVTSSSVNYVSLVDQNVGNTPVSSPSQWAPTSAGAAINGGQGFLSTDISRLVRLFSEPAAWAVGTTYATGAVISYNPTGFPGAGTYWQSLVSSNTGNVPGSDVTHWEVVAPGASLPAINGVNNPAGAAGPAQWTWGKITSLLNFIPGAPSGIAHIGTLTGNGGLAAAFSGTTAQNSTASAEKAFSSGVTDLYIGQNYSGASPASYALSSATIFPPTDNPIVLMQADNVGFGHTITATAYLYGSNSPPSSGTNGVLLGSAVIGSGVYQFNANLPLGASPVTITSTDQVTTYAYWWIEIGIVDVTGGTVGYPGFAYVAQVEFVSASGSGSTSNGVNVEIIGPPLLYTTPIQTWRLGVYSSTTGWPTCGAYADGRLWLGGAVSNRFDACVSNGILGGTLNFAPTDQYGAVAASNAISYTLNSDGLNPIFWMKPDLQGMLMGTQAGEWLVFAPTGGGIAPNNIASRQVTSIGSKNIQPCRTEHTTIFVQRFALKLPEYFPDVFSGKFSAPNLADKTILTRKGVAELAYTNAAEPIVWGRDTLGALFGITYKRDSLASSQPPSYYAWHRHALGSGRIVESICSGPSIGGDLDTLTMVTNDAATGVRHVEVLTDTMDELSALSESWFLDDAVSPSSTSINVTPVAGAPDGGMTLNGLWHLNGKTVQVFAGGLDCGDRGTATPALLDFTVTNGSVFVPFGDGINAGCGKGLFTATFAGPIVVGFTYNSDGQVVRPIAQADTGARNGPGFAKIGRGHRLGVKLVNSRGLSFGTDFSSMLPGLFRQADGVTLIPTLSTYSGIFQDALKDDYSYDRSLCWRVSRPYPANVVAVGVNLATQDQ